MTSEEKFQRDMLIVSDRKAGMSMSECAIKYNLANVNHICKRYGVGGVMSDRESPTKYECKVGEEEISKRIREQWVGFEYVRGYKGTEKPCIIRCITCGYEFEASLISLRQKDKQKRCPKCYKKELRAKKDARDMFVKRERERKAEERRFKKGQELSKQLMYKQCKYCCNRPAAAYRHPSRRGSWRRNNRPVPRFRSLRSAAAG